MELMTQEIKKRFQETGSQEKVKPEDVVCVVKYFNPTGSWTWYATEFDGKDTFFGLVDGFELEWGDFSLSELQSVRGGFGLGIERDLYGGYPKKLGEIPALSGRL
jgi:hypothetical protein